MHRYILAGLVPALIAAPGGTQNRPIVTEAEFLSVLDRSHPAVVGSLSDRAAARADLIAASTLENPIAGAMREDPSGVVEQTDWTLAWKLPDVDRHPRIAARRESLAAAEARLEQRIRRLRLTLREVYAEWSLAAAREERLVALAERVGALAEREAARAARGESSGLEVDRLELAVAALRSRAILAASAGERLRAEAAAWFPDLPPDARPVLPALGPVPDFSSPHPLVRAAEAELEAALAEERAAGRFIASPEITLGWQRQESTADAIDGPILGLFWSVPLFDRKQAERADSEVRVDAARGRLEQVRREVRSARVAARSVYERLVAGLQSARSSLASSQRMLDGSEAA
ncbi:MAG: TolC family protein, partial [Thermoanaerobaculia bacterium]|nr:TolC family protein [Thermoanaerobaculia bacterium]